MAALQLVNRERGAHIPISASTTSVGTPDPKWSFWGLMTDDSGNFYMQIPTGWGTQRQDTGTSQIISVLSALDATDKFATDMSRLEVASAVGNESDFMGIANAIDWARRSAPDFVRAVHLSLAVGAHLLARKLATQGAKQYPSHAELQKMARVLAPPRVVRTDLPPDPSVRLNQEWLRAHADEHRGQWVALRNGMLLAAAATVGELKDYLKDTVGLLVTKVF